MTDLPSVSGITWIVEEAKIVRYLLNPDHPDGASKAKYLLAFGFTADDPGPLAETLARHALDNLPGRCVIPAKGLPRYVFDGHTEAPDGRLMRLRTVWEVAGITDARFITAYPLTR